ncbi:MAG: TIGR01620 family protein [Pseudomonadota bacterium]
MARRPVAISLDESAAEKAAAVKNKPASKPTSKNTGKSKSHEQQTQGRARKPQAVPAARLKEKAQEDYFEQMAEGPLTPSHLPIKKSSSRWAVIFASALIALISVGIGLWVTSIVEELFARHEWLGWAAFALVGILIFSFCILIIRELVSLLRLRKLGQLREDVTNGLQTGVAAKKIIKRIATLYRDRDDIDWYLSEYLSHEEDIVDDKDRLLLFERSVMAPLDREAGRMITSAAKRISVVTAINPAPALDVIFTGYQILRMLRQLTALYGNRPGSLGTMRLAGMVGSQLAITGGLALSDTFIQQFLGKGVAGRLSAKLGEGTVNGILTARIGLAAIDLCRPMPFNALQKPGLSSFISSIFASSEEEKSGARANMD